MTTTAKTSRIPDAWASVGAVRQTSGQLPVYTCNTCQAEVVWATSKRTGNKYLCNTRRGSYDQRYYIGSDIHRCEEVIARHEAFRAEVLREEAARDMVAEVRKMRNALKAGEITEAEYFAFLDTLDA